MAFDAKEFWENKILPWENGRYETDTSSPALLERLADRASRSLRFRIEITGRLLAPHVAGKKVVELGCGSGILTERILQAGATSYTGYDIAESAISAARERARTFERADSVKYELKPVSDLPPLDADIVFSLGLLDWLTDDELEILFKQSGDADYFHAIAEKRSSISQLIHRAYVQISYGHRTGAYRPRYYTIEDIRRISAPTNDRSIFVYRDPRLSFGALLSTLPIT